MWHRPTVLVFDNMDKLLGAELEVEPISSYSINAPDISFVARRLVPDAPADGDLCLDVLECYS